jgi:hypothetical protein
MLRNEPKVEFLWKVSFQTMKEHVEGGFFPEPKTYIAIPNEPFPKGFKMNPRPEYRVFILCSPFDTLEGPQEKLYKCGLPQIDLTKVDWDKEKGSLIKDARWQRLAIDFDDLFRLEFQVKLPDPLDYNVYDDVGEKTAVELVEALHRPDAVKVWSSIPRRLIYPLFLPHEPEKSILYATLVTGSKKYNTYAMCPPLWVYLEAFLGRYSTLEATASMFATWVRAASTILATERCPGFYPKIYKGKTYWSFTPSNEAHQFAINY